MRDAINTKGCACIIDYRKTSCVIGNADFEVRDLPAAYSDGPGE